MKIQITRVDGAIKADPATSYLTNYLRYSHRSFGFEGWRKVNKFETKELYALDGYGALTTFSGFYNKICNLIESEGDTLEEHDHRTPVADPDLQAIRDIDWSSIGSDGLREYQINPVVEFLYKGQQGNGVVSATGGFGKTIVMACTYAAFSHLGNTIVATPLKTVFDQTYDKFCKLFPDRHIGRVGDGYYDISNEITVCTYKSLLKAPLEKCKLLLMDEIQSTTGDKIAAALTNATPVRMFGYTATDRNLFNGADKLIKGLFGERLIHIPYTEAEENGAVVPCHVYMIKLPESAAFSAGTMDAKLVRGIKRNEIRNQLIGEVCRRVPNNWQTLVFVDHIDDHLIPLYSHMPEGTLYVHRGQGKRFGAFSLTPKKQDQNIERFRNGEFQYLLATDALRSGADFPNIRVVIQASGGTSEVEILQEAYRGSRIAPGKNGFFLIDMMDNHDQTLENMSLKRMSIYKKQGWKITVVDTLDEIDWNVFDNPTSKDL